MSRQLSQQIVLLPSTYREVKKVYTSAVNSLDIDPVEMRYLLSGSANGMVAIHDLHNFSGSPQYTCPVVCVVKKGDSKGHKYSVETVQWYTSDTGIFISSGFDKTLKIWDTNKMTPVDTLTYEDRIYSHHMSPVATKHSLIAVGSSACQVSLVDLKTGSFTHILKGHKGAVYTVKWSPISEYVLASGSHDNKALIWDVRMARNCLLTLDQHNGNYKRSGPAAVQTAHNGAVNSIAFTVDGFYLLTFGTDCRLRLWNTRNGRNSLVNYGSINNEQLKCVKIDVSHFLRPDVVFVPHESNIDVFCIHSGSRINRLIGHYNEVNCVLHHPVLQECYSGGNDRNILVWTPKMSTTEAFEEYLLSGEKGIKMPSDGLMRDTWSSDEDED